jgi:protein tyrosine kinase modulator
LYNGSRVNGNRYPAPVGTEPGPGTSVGAAEGEYVLSLADLFGVIRRRLWIILLVVGVLTGAAVAFSLAQTPMYEASIRILVGLERGTTEVPVGVYDLQQLTQTMTEGVNSRPVAEATIQQLGLRITQEEFLANLSVEQIPNTQFIQVSYTDPSPERAKRVANATGKVFAEQVSEVSPSASAITATVWERAVVPHTPVSPNPLRNGLLALMLGLMLGVGLAFLLEYLDDSWRSPEEVEQISGVPTFGVIPELEVSKGRKKGSYRDG